MDNSQSRDIYNHYLSGVLNAGDLSNTLDERAAYLLGRIDKKPRPMAAVLKDVAELLAEEGAQPPVAEGEVAWVCVPEELLKAGRPLRMEDVDGDHADYQDKGRENGGPFVYLTKEAARAWVDSNHRDAMVPVPVRVSFLRTP